MRTLATACEAYVVDTNVPPVGYYQTNYDALMSAGQRWSFWTTPIAYMSSIPSDPFAITGKLNNNASNALFITMDNRYLFTTTVNHRIDHVSIDNLTKAAEAFSVKWLLYSWGPSRRRVAADKPAVDIMKVVAHVPSTGTQNNYPDALYDASNGTTSYGWIIRTNKGIESGS